MTLHALDLDDVPVAGVLDHERTETGISWRRLPAWTRHQIVDPGMGLVLGMPAGARLEFVSETRTIELDLQLTTVRSERLTLPAPAVDLVVDGSLQATATVEDHATLVLVGVPVADFRLEPGGPATVRFEGLPGDGRVVEIWLPHASSVELREVRVDAGTTLTAVGRTRRRWAHYGSSISHCLEAPSPTATWPAIAARLADVDLMNFGLAGQCMLDQQVARTLRDLDADVISVKAGINVVNGDTMRERTFVPALHGFLDTVRDGHPETPLLVVTPIVCPVAEDHPGPTIPGEDGQVGVVPRVAELSTGALTLTRIRTLVHEVVAARRAAGDTALHMLDGLELFGHEDAAQHLPDGLHPSPEGYRLMGERFHDKAFRSGPFA